MPIPSLCGRSAAISVALLYGHAKSYLVVAASALLHCAPQVSVRCMESGIRGFQRCMAAGHRWLGAVPSSLQVAFFVGL